MNFPQQLKLLKNWFTKERTLFVVLGLIALIGLIQIIFWSAPGNFKIGSVVEIPEGSTLSQTASIFKEQGIIRSVFWFKVFGVAFYHNADMKAGDYVFTTPISVWKAVNRVANGEFELTLVKVTIPEGYTKLQIANLLASKFTLFDTEYFLSNAPEGYLFPDTYFFYQDVKAKSVSARMQDIFNTKTEKLRAEAKEQKKNFANVVVIASILEEEVKTAEDMKIVSGILYNRLAIDMPLQVDAATSTYSHKGLPLTPISNPGLTALEAALYPTKTPYFYYLSDKAGKIYYAKTFDEHQVNRERYLNK